MAEIDDRLIHYLATRQRKHVLKHSRNGWGGPRNLTCKNPQNYTSSKSITFKTSLTNHNNNNKQPPPGFKKTTSLRKFLESCIYRKMKILLNLNLHY
ncbi:hypothetical protein Hanom_Chr09g00855271 [Helianthus anomalus]